MTKQIKSRLGKILTGNKIKIKMKNSIRIKTKKKNTIKEQVFYRSIPAPIKIPDDPWFSCTTNTEKRFDISPEMDYNTQVKMVHPHSGESPTIHQDMYEEATKNWTSLQAQGGSETFQECPGGWNSGTGYK